MNIILTMAISANGIIATSSGDEDFLSETNWQQFIKLANQVGNFIWGRKTYDLVMSWGNDPLIEFKNVTKIIISHTPIKLKEGFILAHSPEEAVEILKNKGFSEAIITGGATINSEFAKLRLIDKVRLDINPALIGNGVPVFLPKEFLMKLNLLSVERLENDIVELWYEVKK